MELGISSSSLYPLETEKSLEFLCQNEIPVTEIFFKESPASEEKVLPFKSNPQRADLKGKTVCPNFFAKR